MADADTHLGTELRRPVRRRAGYALMILCVCIRSASLYIKLIKVSVRNVCLSITVGVASSVANDVTMIMTL